MKKKPPAYVPTGPLHAEPLQGMTSAESVAERLEVDVADLAWVPYARVGILYMSKPAQLDDDAELNSNAMMLMNKMGHDSFARMAIRGPVILFPNNVPWGPLEGDLRPGVAR